jgi:hypothetical protein
MKFCKDCEFSTGKLPPLQCTHPVATFADLVTGDQGFKFCSVMRLTETTAEAQGCGKAGALWKRKPIKVPSGNNLISRVFKK